ncbi:MAG: hypothetical protein MJ211_15430 [Bacteroidales bacterium]|nr:hypothetical protein [Bacteroidales bacterium]
MDSGEYISAIILSSFVSCSGNGTNSVQNSSEDTTNLVSNEIQSQESSNTLEVCESYFDLFRNYPEKNDLAFSEIPKDVCQCKNNVYILTSNCCGLLTEIDDNGTYQSITVGSKMADARKNRILTKFLPPFGDNKIEEYQEDGKYIIKRTLFVSSENKCQGKVLFVSNDKEGKIQEIRFLTEPYDLSNVQVDYFKPVCAYISVDNKYYSAYEGNVSIISYKQYNEKGEITEEYFVDDRDICDANHENNYYKYNRNAGKIDTVFLGAMDLSFYDLYEHSEALKKSWHGGYGRQSYYNIPKFEDCNEIKYDDNGRVIFAIFGDESGESNVFDFVKVTFNYNADYCIKEVYRKTKEDDGFGDYYEDENSYKIYEYYQHTKEKLPTMQEVINK